MVGGYQWRLVGGVPCFRPYLGEGVFRDVLERIYCGPQQLCSIPPGQRPCAEGLRPKGGWVFGERVPSRALNWGPRGSISKGFLRGSDGANGGWAFVGTHRRGVKVEGKS